MPVKKQERNEAIDERLERMDLTHIAREAYDSYRKSISSPNEVLPLWKDLDPGVVVVWSSFAKYIARVVLGEMYDLAPAEEWKDQPAAPEGCPCCMQLRDYLREEYPAALPPNVGRSWAEIAISLLNEEEGRGSRLTFPDTNKDLEEILEDRAQIYGDSHKGHEGVGRMWGALLSSFTGLDIPDLPADIVLLMMEANKVHRAVLPNGRGWIDSYTDARGYNLLAERSASEYALEKKKEEH